jgi:serpin B
MRFKRLVAAMLAVAMVLTTGFINVSKADAKASKLKLSKKSVTIYIGESAEVKISGKNASKVKWKVTKGANTILIKKNKKKITILGFDAGKATITAKVGKKTLKVKVTVKEESANNDTTEYKFTPSEGTKVLTESLSRTASASATQSAAFAKDVTDFSFNVLREARKYSGEKKVLVSPDSISTALAMTVNGARGATKDELMNVLAPNVSLEDYNMYLSGMNDRLSADKELIYDVSDSIWIRDVDTLKISDQFLKTNYDYYNAEVFKAPFDDSTVKDMNSWVNANTRGMIPGIIDELKPENLTVLINTVAFEGQWSEPYESYRIGKDSFTNDDMTKTDVEYLHEQRSAYYKINDRLAFEKYYKGGAIKFVGILPKEGESIDEALKDMNGEAFVNGLSNPLYASVRTKLPKFKYDYSVELTDIMKNLGLSLSMSNYADFSGMVTPDSKDELKIGQILHKTHIELDENGTKAAAATAIIMNKATSVGPKEEEFVDIYLDRPFIYALVDSETNIPLFIGTIDSMK